MGGTVAVTISRHVYVGLQAPKGQSSTKCRGHNHKKMKHPFNYSLNLYVYYGRSRSYVSVWFLLRQRLHGSFCTYSVGMHSLYVPLYVLGAPLREKCVCE